jgi:hypothetical protein
MAHCDPFPTPLVSLEYDTLETLDGLSFILQEACHTISPLSFTGV